jgi:hypothetical protein
VSRIELISSPYNGKSVISSGQECVNLYAEINATTDPQAPSQTTYYLTPGTLLYSNPNFARNARGSYRTSIGTAYYVVGPNVYFLLSTGQLILIGEIADRPNQVYFKDNGLCVVLVDGQSGYVIDINANTFAQITDPNFYSADYVDLIDTFFIFNRSGTNQFFISLSNVNFALLSTTGAFDPLDIAAKSGFNDPIVGLAAVHRELWLVGNLTTEIWVGTGAADFYFQEVQGAYVNHGCAAQYSIAVQDVLIFYIMQDQQGNGLVVQGQGYDVTEISTPRIVEEFKKYQSLKDAIGFCFQLGGHAFYALVFTIANKGWLYDLKTSQWNEWNYTDLNGVLNRPRANCCMFAFNTILVGDWQNGNLLALDVNTFTDYSSDSPVQPVTRIRTFPHTIDNNDKVSYKSFDADMEVGTILDGSNPQVSLSWSDDKGATYGNPVMNSMGALGQTFTTITWNRLGEARDRVFKLQWSANCRTALNGGFIERKKASK